MIKEQLKVLENYTLRQIGGDKPISLGINWFSEDDLYVTVHDSMGIEFSVGESIARELTYKGSSELMRLSNDLMDPVGLDYDQRDKVYEALRAWHLGRRVAIARIYYINIHTVTFTMDKENKELSEVSINDFRFRVTQKT